MPSITGSTLATVRRLAKAGSRTMLEMSWICQFWYERKLTELVDTFTYREVQKERAKNVPISSKVLYIWRVICAVDLSHGQTIGFANVIILVTLKTFHNM